MGKHLTVFPGAYHIGFWSTFLILCTNMKCKKPWGLGIERKNLLLLIRNVRNCIVKVCCTFLESTSGLLFCLLHRHSIQTRLWPGTIVTVLQQVLWAPQDTAEQHCTREALGIHPLTQTVELAH